MTKKLAILFLCLVFIIPVRASLFIVTSNADIGAGSLREAINYANANGTASTDTIAFNIPEPVFNNRIIDLVSELPSLSSNIVIDGTTQPGDLYATTDARICLRKLDYAPFFSMLKIENASNVKIYGLCIYYGYWQGNFGPPSRSKQLYDINLINSSEITIGNINKSNVLMGADYGIYCGDSSKNITIQNNFFQSDYYISQPNHLDTGPMESDCSIFLTQSKNVMIGGNSEALGNIFGLNSRAMDITSNQNKGNGFLTIRFNKFGFNYDKKEMVPRYAGLNYVHIGNLPNYGTSAYGSTITVDYRVEFTDNTTIFPVSIDDISDSLIIQRNNFTSNYPLLGAVNLSKLMLYKNTLGGIIGGEDIYNQNFFTDLNRHNGSFAVVLQDCGPIRIIKNVFECNDDIASPTSINSFGDQIANIPFAQIDFSCPDSIYGRGTPNAIIDLYYDDECTACEGKKYFTTVPCDAAGKWKYTGRVTATMVAVATSTKGYSGRFSFPTFNQDSIKLRNPTCGKKNGSITGIRTEGADTYFWLNYNTKDTPSHTLDLLNAAPGQYFLYAVHGGTCMNYIGVYNMENVTPVIDKSNTTVTQPTCGLFNGAIQGIYVKNSAGAGYKWVDSSGTIISTQLNIDKLNRGTYKFIVTDTSAAGGCADTASFTLVNQSGPTLNTASIKITNATCGKSNGSISGITASNFTGTPYIQWEDSASHKLVNTFDLNNIAPGNYRLKFKDQTGCDTIITPYYTVANLGAITIDTTAAIISSSRCDGPSGSITNIKVKGADSYQWTNVTGNIIAQTVDLVHVSTGSYILKAMNITGCSLSTSPIFIAQANFTDINVTGYITGNALCNKNIGFITINNFSRNPANYTFSWMDSSTHTTMSASPSLNNLYGGTYQLTANDSNQCSKIIFSVKIATVPPPSIDYNNMVITADECNQKTGSINSIKINGLTGPTIFTWVDSFNNNVSASADLKSAGAGNYTLKIRDGNVCDVQSNPIEITNQDVAIDAPVYNNLTIPRFSNATMNVKNHSNGAYILTADANGNTVLQQNLSGDFTVNNIISDTSFYIKRIIGSCSGSTTKVFIHVVDESYIAIPNAFTPNHDGRNDKLKVGFVGYVKLNSFRIYNRWGKMVYETHQMGEGWDGSVKGEPQVSGIYVWIAEGLDINNKVLRNSGTILLIR